MNLETVVRVVRIALSRPALLAVAAGALLLLAGECKRHRETDAIAMAPKVAVNVPRFERYKPESIEATIQAWRPPERAARRIERDFGVTVKSTGSDKGADLLAHKEVTVDCGEGGTRTLEIVATLPEGSGPREAEIRTRQSGQKFFGLTGVWGLGGGIKKTPDDDRWKLYGLFEPARVGRWHLRLEGGAESRAGDIEPFVEVNAEIRF